MFLLEYDSNEKQSSRVAILRDVCKAYFKNKISVSEADISVDLKLSSDSKIVMAELKQLDDVFGSLPPRGRLGKQCMDMAIEADYAYLAILGSEDELREAMPRFSSTREGIRWKNDFRLMHDEDILLHILGEIKSLGIDIQFLSRNPFLAFRTLLKFMISDIVDDPPISLMTKPHRGMHAVNMLSNLPGVGWERASEIIKQFGSVTAFMIEAQQCCEADDFTKLEEITINGRKLGKSARKIFDVEGVWS